MRSAELPIIHLRTAASFVRHQRLAGIARVLSCGRRGRADFVRADTARQSVAPVGVLRDLDRQDHVLLRGGGGDEFDLGLHRHLEPGPRRVFRARRLRVRHVSDAHDRPRRAVPERSARLHGVPRLEGVSVVLVVHRALLVRRAAGGAGPRLAGLRVRLLRVSLAHQGRVLFDHHAGADVRVHVAVLPQRHRLRRQ